MFSDKITYEDFNGDEVTEEVYFNISKMEALELETRYPEGYGEHLQSIVDGNDVKEIFEAFKDIVKTSSGVKSEDGKRFVKSDTEYEKFKASPVYDEFMMKLMTEEDYALDFVLGVMPSVEGLTKDSLIKSLNAAQ